MIFQKAKTVILKILIWSHPIIWDICVTYFLKGNNTILETIILNIPSLVVITILGYLLSYYFVKINKMNTKVNDAIRNHALQMNFLKSILSSNNIKECNFEIARIELTESEMKEAGFDEKDVINKNKLRLSMLKPIIQKL
jgi:hypothetical protein